MKHQLHSSDSIFIQLIEENCYSCYIFITILQIFLGKLENQVSQTEFLEMFAHYFQSVKNICKLSRHLSRVAELILD